MEVNKLKTNEWQILVWQNLNLRVSLKEKWKLKQLIKEVKHNKCMQFLPLESNCIKKKNQI